MFNPVHILLRLPHLSRVLRSGFAIGVLAFGCACAPTVSFDVELSETTTVDGSPLGGIFSAFTFGAFSGIDFETTSEFENNDANRELVESARLKSITLSVIDPDDGNFDWLNEIEFFVEADGLDRTRISSDEIADGLDSVSLTLDDVELAPFVRAPSVFFTTEVNALSPAVDTEIQADIVMGVTAGLGSP